MGLAGRGTGSAVRAFGGTVLAPHVGFTEGPVFRQSGEIVFTSLDRGHVYSLDCDRLTLLAVTGGVPNGATEDRDGSIYLAMAGGSFVGRPPSAAPGGILAIRPHGRLDWITMDPISPNDLCFGPDGLLYVTDPTRNGKRNDGRLWRVDVLTGRAELLVSVPWYPNGIGFGTDNALYVVESGAQRIVRFEVSDSGLSTPEPVIQLTEGRADGFAVDSAGDLVIAIPGVEDARSTIEVWSTDGVQKDVLTSEPGAFYTNVALSASGQLVVTDAGRVAAARAGTDSGGAVRVCQWPRSGLALHPFRGG